MSIQKITPWLWLFLLMSCARNAGPGNVNQAQGTLFQQIEQAPELSLYRSALKRAGLYADTTFSNNSPLTVFAPVDSAWLAAGLTDDSIQAYDPQALGAILRYCMVYGRLGSASLVGFYSEDVRSKDTIRPNLVKNYYGIFFNGAPMVKPDIETGDGVLQEMARVVIPPSTNLLDLVGSRPDLRCMAIALRQIGYDPMLTVLPSPDSNVNRTYSPGYTLIAPTDSAFIQFGFPDTNAVAQADVTLLKSFMINYLYGNRHYTCDYLGGVRSPDPTGGTFPYGLGAQSLEIEADGLTFNTAGNIIPPRIVVPNLSATNGVLHIVDQVIEP